MADSVRWPVERFGLVALGGAAAVLIAAIGLSRHAVPASDPAAVADPQAPADPEVPIADLEARMRAHPDDGEGWRSLARSYFQAQRYPDAAGAYARATKLLPGRADLWSAFGEAQTLASNAVDSIAHHAFGKALAIDPKDSRARYFLAVEKDVAGDHKGAVDDWIALLRDGPNDAPWAQSVHDLILQVAGQHKIDVTGRVPEVAAASAVAGGEEPARAAIPGPTSDQISAAAALTPSQQNEMARGMVDRLARRLAAQPGDLDGWVRLMRARMVLGDTAAAGADLAKARQAFAGNATALARIGQAARTLNVPGA